MNFSLTLPQRKILQYLNHDGHRIEVLQYKQYDMRPIGEPVRHHLVNTLESLGLIWRHPYTLHYVITEPGKKYLQNPRT